MYSDTTKQREIVCQLKTNERLDLRRQEWENEGTNLITERTSKKYDRKY